MACEYCDFKVPKKNSIYRVGSLPVGKPLVRRRDEIYTDFIILAHNDGSRCNPPMDLDQYTIEWMNGGVGFYAVITHCPMCGRKLGGDA